MHAPDSHLDGPVADDDWVGLTEGELPVAAAYDWAVRPDCGAVVLFSGTVRDHAEGREGVTHLVYEAYESQVEPRLREIVAETRSRWPSVGRLALLHRTGRLELGETSVLVVASAPHRPDAFDAARFAIDALKATAPIWKLEEWAGGTDWGTGATAPVDVSSVPSARAPGSD